MEANTMRFGMILLLLSAFVVLVSASADGGYGKSQLEGYVPPKTATPKDNAAYEKLVPKIPAKPVIPKEEDVSYKKADPKIPTKPVIQKEELVSYEKTYPKIPTKPLIPKGEDVSYKADPKIPTKSVIPKEEHLSYEKTYPKIPTKPLIPKGEDVSYKADPKIPTKPVILKEEHLSYEKTYPKIPTKPMIPKEDYVSYEKVDPKIPTKTLIPKEEHVSYEKTNPKIPSTLVIPKEEYGANQKSDPKVPTKPVLPKEEHESYKKTYPKLPTNPVIPTLEKSLLPEVPKHPKNIAVQGLIYCKRGFKLIPLQGATVKVTCLTVRKNGYGSTPFSFSSCPADEKGYFLAKMPSSKLLNDDTWEITECKAVLENSPWTDCNVPEDTNGGLTGARLAFSRHLNRDEYCLSAVGPFIYNPGHESLPKEGY